MICSDCLNVIFYVTVQLSYSSTQLQFNSKGVLNKMFTWATRYSLSIARQCFLNYLVHCQSHLSRHIPSSQAHWMLCVFLLLCSHISHASLGSQRADYQVAAKQLAKGQMADVKRSIARLRDYPLVAYLEYGELEFRLESLPRKDIDTFLKKYSGSVLAVRLQQRLLSIFIKRAMWKDYIAYYDPRLNSTHYQCYYLRSKLALGQNKEVFDAVKPLWLSAKSQPDSCAPLFKSWIQAGHLTQELAWQRFALGMSSHKTSFASFVARTYLRDQYKTLAEQWIKVHGKPTEIANGGYFAGYQAHGDKKRQIIAHGIKLFAKQDLNKALKVWNLYRQRTTFDLESEKEINRAISVAATLKPGDLADQWFASAANLAADTYTTELHIRRALRYADWPAVRAHCERLPKDYLQSSNTWRYWLARAYEEELLKGRTTPVVPTELYKAVAKTRSFHGFLAADRLKLNYSMEDVPIELKRDALKVLLANGALQRALEYHALGKINEAIVEWSFAMRYFTPTQQALAGKLAALNGWHDRAIYTMSRALYWNDVQIRFPIPQQYKTSIVSAAEKNHIDPTWIFAVARQESTFIAEAKSPAGALGLMQLMPYTAQHIAKKMGIPHNNLNLLNASTNVTIGSRYLRSLFEQYGENRILATTAYNAGPGRVQTWRKITKATITPDMWVETIPFSETRTYVQNVLAFNVVYGYRLNRKVPVFSSTELKQML